MPWVITFLGVLDFPIYPFCFYTSSLSTATFLALSPYLWMHSRQPNTCLNAT